ncbi:hypothetical protein D210916BOD24_15720 [Alteromonas sp. D210916BOD_24]|uniref:DUF6841 family protein n=1 Tax=Alteromonas sp. D210916BOD_24 TaxID=3157618 RepID=UPI00399CC9F6
MRVFFAVCLVILMFNQQKVLAKQAVKAPETEQVRAFFDAYMNKYNHYLTTNEFNDQPYLYHDTIMVMSSSVAPYTIGYSAFYQRTRAFLDNLKAQGVRRVNWVDINVHLIDKNLAVASNTAARYLENGDEFNRVGVTYMMRKANDEWRITSFMVHNAAGVIDF